MSERRVDRRELVVRGALGAAGIYALVDSLVTEPARAALAARPVRQPEQHILRGQRLITRDGTQVVVPPLHHQIVTANLRIASTREALLAARRRLEHQLARVSAEYRSTPAGVGTTVAWGASYFQRFVPVLADGKSYPEYLPVDVRTSREAGARTAVLQPSPRFPSDDESLLLEDNDVAFLFRSDRLEHVAFAAETVVGALGDVFEITSIRKGFVGGGFEGGVGLPKQMALTAGIDGAELIPDGSQLFLGFTSTQRRALAPDRITNFETLLGLTDQWPDGYFRGGTIMHLSHLFEDVGTWWRSFSFDDQTRRMGVPGVELRSGHFTLPQPAGHVETTDDVAGSAGRDGVVGHSASLQHVSRLARDVVDNYGNVRRKGATLVHRADFNTLDNPFFWSSQPALDGQRPEPAAGVHFVAFVPTAAIFHRMRYAMDGQLADGTKLGLDSRSRGLGINSVIRATHRQNFLVPPRSARSFPLAEQLRRTGA